MMTVAEFDALTRDELVALRAQTVVDLESAEAALVLDHMISPWEMTERAGRRLELQRLLHAIDERIRTEEQPP